MSWHPDGDGILYQLVSAVGGTAALSPDGRSVLFTPTPGYSGAAGFTVSADDGFSSSGPAFVSINVSTATLLSVEIVNRRPQLATGEREQLVVVGKFADQENVPLLGNYLSFTSSNSAVLNVDSSGVLRGEAQGYAAVIARRGGFAAATAVTVGEPADPNLLVLRGLSIYPDALTLPEVGGQRQFLAAGDADLSHAVSGASRRGG